MKPHRFLRLALLVAGALIVSSTAAIAAAAQPASITPDMTGAPGERGWKLINRGASLIDKEGAQALHLEGKGGQGYVRLEGFTFANGIIEFDARGRNVLQGSFVGIAFHGAKVDTYDAIYFRAFNFRAEDPVRHSHAVQYISHPIFTWKKLRAENPGVYEKPIVPAPDPDAWFHVRIVVAWPQVSVFVNNAQDPSLVVKQLSDRKSGWIALWTDESGGDFANLKITPAEAPGSK